jgi:hemolysin activation/secretion protein
VRASAQQTRELPWNMQLFGRVSGQFTQSPLVSNEQLSIGGADTVRGYLESTSLGDYGFSSTVELRNTYLSKLLQLPAGAAHFYLFYDAGAVQIMDPLPSQESTFDLSSWGAGFRVGGWHGFDVDFAWARATARVGTIEPGDSRIHFLFRYAF